MAHDERAAAVWVDPDTFGTCLIALGADRYGSGCVNWLPDTWRAEVEEDCGVKIPQRNLDRLMGACALLIHPDAVRTSAASFHHYVEAVAGEWFDPHVWHPPTTAECLWAVVEAYFLDPPNPKAAWGPEVTRYVNMIAAEEGYSALPSPFVSFHLKADTDVFKNHDYAGDQETALAAQAGNEMREEDLGDWLNDRLKQFVEKLRVLPLKSGLSARTAAEVAAVLGNQ